MKSAFVFLSSTGSKKSDVLKHHRQMGRPTSTNTFKNHTHKNKQERDLPLHTTRISVKVTSIASMKASTSGRIESFLGLEPKSSTIYSYCASYKGRPQGRCGVFSWSTPQWFHNKRTEQFESEIVIRLNRGNLNTDPQTAKWIDLLDYAIGCQLIAPFSMQFLPHFSSYR